MDEVIVVHFLGVDDVTVLLLAQVGGVDAVGAQELPVGHAEGLADGLCDELRLWGEAERFLRGKLLSNKKNCPQWQDVRKITAVSMRHSRRFFVNDNNLHNF